MKENSQYHNFSNIYDGVYYGTSLQQTWYFGTMLIKPFNRQIIQFEFSLTISLCIYADSRMIGPPRTPALGYEFLNKKLIRGRRRMDAVAAKSDAVTAWKCTATDAYLRLQTLTDAYRRWFPVRGFCSFRVWPCQSVPQCDWAFRSCAQFSCKLSKMAVSVPRNSRSVIIISNDSSYFDF